MNAASRSWPWVVCEDENRWMPAVRRFAPQMLPKNRDVTLAQIETADAKQVNDIRRGIVLWGCGVEDVSYCLECVIETKKISPALLQFVAIPGLTPLESLAFGEIGANALLSHPEQLPKWSTMLQRYFAAQ